MRTEVSGFLLLFFSSDQQFGSAHEGNLRK